MSQTAVVNDLVVSSLAYENAIDLLSETEGEQQFGGLTLFRSKTECGKPTIVIINQLDTEECVQIIL